MNTLSISFQVFSMVFLLISSLGGATEVEKAPWILVSRLLGKLRGPPEAIIPPLFPPSPPPQLFHYLHSIPSPPPRPTLKSCGEQFWNSSVSRPMMGGRSRCAGCTTAPTFGRVAAALFSCEPFIPLYLLLLLPCPPISLLLSYSHHLRSRHKRCPYILHLYCFCPPLNPSFIHISPFSSSSSSPFCDPLIMRSLQHYMNEG